MQEREMLTSKLIHQQKTGKILVLIVNSTTLSSYVTSLKHVYFLLIGFLSCNRTFCNQIVCSRTVCFFFYFYLTSPRLTNMGQGGHNSITKSKC